MAKLAASRALGAPEKESLESTLNLKSGPLASIDEVSTASGDLGSMSKQEI